MSWQCIYLGVGELEVAELRQLDKAAIESLFATAIADPATRKKLSVQVYSAKHSITLAQPAESQVIITDFNKFKEGMPLYPYNMT